MDPGNTRSVGGSCVRAIQGENGRVRGLRVPSKRMTRSRRVSGIAAVLVAAFSLSSCNGAPAKTATLVPWLALTPLSTTTSTSTSTTTAIAPAPPCVASHLRVSMGQGEGAMSNEVFLVLITNVASTCRLSGYPDLIGRTSTRPLGALVVGKTGTYIEFAVIHSPRQTRHGLILGPGLGSLSHVDVATFAIRRSTGVFTKLLAPCGGWSLTRLRDGIPRVFERVDHTVNLRSV